MLRSRFLELRTALLEDADKLTESKGRDYTRSSEDCLLNFKEVAARTGLTPLQVLQVYQDKHQFAIANYVRTNGQSESEPIAERIKDNINYLLLLHALIVERQTPAVVTTITSGSTSV